MPPKPKWYANNPTPRIVEEHRRQLELFEGRPKRDTIINSEDILNLKIALGTCKSIKEFCEVI